MRPLNLCCVTDGKPGHRTQLAGLAQALGELQPVVTSWLDVSADVPGPVPLPDLILAAGHRTHWAGLRLKWSSKAKLVVLMKPSLPRFLFDLCVIPEHDSVAPSSRVLTTRGMLNDIRPGAGADPQSGLLLLGGPSKHHGWSDSAILEQVGQLRALLPAVRWQVTTSRRTPDSLDSQLAQLASADFAFTPFAQTDRDWLRRQMAACGVIWITEDSASMVYEAMTAGARVGVLAVPRLGESRVSRGLDALLQEGAVTDLEGLQAAGDMPVGAGTLDEAGRVAQYLTQWMSGARRHQ
ncbi:mitochondrial fission ELM1 family protein [Haliea sp. E17]|uniref:mitochondrial fission ELM1 family protein n=1 Tax=Haliea sp. E17 TaxID=3401576 RepID=UPI003AAD3F9C